MRWLGAVVCSVGLLVAGCGSSASPSVSSTSKTNGVAQALRSEGAQVNLYWPANSNFQQFVTRVLAPGFEAYTRKTYGVDVQDLPAGAMSAHNDLAFVIDRTGIIRQEISDDPGPGTTSTQSSFGALLAGDAREALSQ